MGAANLIDSRRGQALRGGARRSSSATAACSSRWPTRPTSSAIDDIALMTGYEVRPAVASREDIARAHRPPHAPRRRRRSRPRRRGGGAAARRGRRPARVRRRRAGHQARQRDHRPGRRAGRLRRPPVARTARAARALPHRRRARTTSATVPRRMVAGVISRVKIMGDLDIAERRVPQDGRVGADRSTATTSTCASSRCPPCTASRSSCASSTSPSGVPRARAASAWPTRSAPLRARPSARPTAPCS